jgi:hypothetical protein
MELQRFCTCGHDDCTSPIFREYPEWWWWIYEETDQWEIEECCRLRMETFCKTEAEAYNRLVNIQGQVVPRFFGSFVFDAGSLREMPLDVSPEPRGILLEFIEGINLLEATKNPLFEQTFPDATEKARKCLSLIGPLGVIAGDLRTANLMIRCSDSNLFLFDFGQAEFKLDSESEQHWRERVSYHWEADAIHGMVENRIRRENDPR